MKHSDAVNRIRLAVSEMGGLSVPYTVGMFRTLEDERRIKIAQAVKAAGGRYVLVRFDERTDGVETLKRALAA
jgi:hypothetical protein